MKVKEMRAVLNEYDGELELYIETAQRYNSHCFYSSKPGVKIYLERDVVTNKERAHIVILDDKDEQQKDN